jgi:hypothetical protein
VAVPGLRRVIDYFEEMFAIIQLAAEQSLVAFFAGVSVQGQPRAPSSAHQMIPCRFGFQARRRDLLSLRQAWGHFLRCGCLTGRQTNEWFVKYVMIAGQPMEPSARFRQSVYASDRMASKGSST